MSVRLSAPSSRSDAHSDASERVDSRGADLSHGHYRSRAGEGRYSVAPEAQIEPEIEKQSEQEIATCEGGLGAAGPFPTDIGNLFTFAEIVTAHTSQEVTETSHFTPSQTLLLTPMIPFLLLTIQAHCKQ